MVTLLSKKLSIFSSIVILISSGLIVTSLFFPWWAMKFIAPQYPEGLNIIVYPDHLEGQIDIVNGLNHYIGMANFSEENFPELNYLNYLIGGLAAITALTAIFRKKAFLYGLIGLFIIGGSLGAYDLHRWLRNFGTNLSPQAPIKIDPFIPPMIGQNKLANFTTFSTVEMGAFLVIAAFVLLLIPLWKDRKK